jgi:hypothetical protein
MSAGTVGAAVGAAAAARNRRPRPSPVQSRAATVANGGAGFILGLLVWGWVIMPLIHGGPTGVRNTLKAKFFNKRPDGSWLP